MKDLTELDTETLLRLGPIVAGQKIVADGQQDQLNVLGQYVVV